jgi:hypothetical protein
MASNATNETPAMRPFPILDRASLVFNDASM